MSVAMATLLAACGSKPPMRWVALPLPATPAHAASESSAASPVLIVRRLHVPEYLQSASVRYRERDSVMAEWPDVRWADRIEVGLTEHLQMRLRQRLPGWTVCDRQCPADAAALTLNIDIAPLDYIRPARTLQAQARWQLSWRDRASATPPDERPMPMPLPMTHRSQQAMQTYALPVTRDDAEGQAEAMGRLLDELAQAVSTAVLTAAPQAPPSAPMPGAPPGQPPAAVRPMR
ncbi:MAG: ABC-type transport auxiliary lipoprotein family protein [Aquabacterium sp.]